MKDMMSWCRNGTYGQPSETSGRFRALFETAEPNTSKESPDQSLLKKLVSTWSSRKRDTNQMPRYKQVSGRSATSQSPKERRWTVRMQRAYPGRLPYLPSRWCFVQQKAGIARPPSDSPWGSRFDDGKDTREMLDTSPQKTNKESDKWVRWV